MTQTMRTFLAIFLASILGSFASKAFPDSGASYGNFGAGLSAAQEAVLAALTEDGSGNLSMAAGKIFKTSKIWGVDSNGVQIRDHAGNGGFLAQSSVSTILASELVLNQITQNAGYYAYFRRIRPVTGQDLNFYDTSGSPIATIVAGTSIFDFSYRPRFWAGLELLPGSVSNPSAGGWTAVGAETTSGDLQAVFSDLDNVEFATNP